MESSLSRASSSPVRPPFGMDSTPTGVKLSRLVPRCRRALRVANAFVVIVVISPTRVATERIARTCELMMMERGASSPVQRARPLPLQTLALALLQFAAMGACARLVAPPASPRLQSGPMRATARRPSWERKCPQKFHAVRCAGIRRRKEQDSRLSVRSVRGRGSRQR